jgi:hypothetical protein
MTLAEEMIHRFQSYLEAEISFEELAEWENIHETDLLDLGTESAATQLAATVSMIEWMHRRGDLPAEQVHDYMSENYAEIMTSRATP